MTGIKYKNVFIQTDKNNQVCELHYINKNEVISKGRHYTCGHLLNTYKGQPISLCFENLQKDIDSCVDEQ